MKLDMSKWKALSIKNRLKKGFRLTTFVASASGVIAGILMILVSMRYSSALTFYGFSQGDIGKVMVTFSETRSATRALIGYTASDTLSKMSDTHDSKKESFQKYWKELQSSIKTGEEQDIYDIIHFLRREMLNFTAFPVFFVSNLLLVQRKKYYFNRATVSRNCSIVL